MMMVMMMVTVIMTTTMMMAGMVMAIMLGVTGIPQVEHHGTITGQTAQS